ncbi:MAG: hypothetical protein KAJ19_21785 [Gammaproteobacteria bacterium]|nr:hypothetical protein [Gammaproteobacteria bacterium]
MPNCRGIIDIIFDGEEVVLSLPMEVIERIEAMTGIGMLKLISQAETKELTLTNAALILRMATRKVLTKKQTYDWIDDNGVVKLFSVMTELIAATFNQDVNLDEEDDGKK